MADGAKNPDLLEDMAAGVELFNRQIIGLPVPDGPTMLNPKRAEFRMNHIREELAEIQAVYDKPKDDLTDKSEVADGFMDVAYISLGALVEMGIVPGAVFQAVQRANMDRKRGEVSKRPGSLGYDAVKPEGWKPPQIARAIYQMSPSVIKSLSPVFLELAALRAQKGADYNTGMELRDYFPMGHRSYFQMVWVKVKRLQSLVTVPRKAVHERVRDSILDALNYLTYWAEAIDRKDPDVAAE